MDNMQSGIRWSAIAAMVVMMALVGVMAYNFGVAQGFVESGRIATAPGAAAPIFYDYPRHWGWGWGPGFGFAPFLGLFWVFLMFALIRRVVWGPRWYRRHYGHYGCWGPYDYDDWYYRRGPGGPGGQPGQGGPQGPQPPPPTTQL